MAIFLKENNNMKLTYILFYSSFQHVNKTNEYTISEEFLLIQKQMVELFSVTIATAKEYINKKAWKSIELLGIS